MRVNLKHTLYAPYSGTSAALQPAAARSVPAAAPAQGGSAAFAVNISPAAWSAYARDKAEAAPLVNALREASKVCAACESRSYKDQSDDPSVSFQNATRMNPGEAASLVAAHEQEHVSNEQQRAEKEGREIISQTVTLQTGICPECGRVYIAGGVTRTVSAGRPDADA